MERRRGRSTAGGHPEVPVIWNSGASLSSQLSIKSDHIFFKFLSTYIQIRAIPRLQSRSLAADQLGVK